MNFGQMFMWHIVLMPLVLVAIVGAHVLLVRVRGVSHPLPERATWGRAARKAAAKSDAGPWRGPTRRYDILKEGAVATLVVGALTLVMAGVLSSPNVPPVTMQTWGKVAPVDLVYTAATELNGTSGTATYGPPYNHGTDGVQQVGPVDWQKVAGVTPPVNAAEDFLLIPPSRPATTTPGPAPAPSTLNAASPRPPNKRGTADADAA